MRVLLVEDEPLAADRLAIMLRKLVPEIEIVDHFDTVEDTVEFFNTAAPQIDLAFFDIQLADGLSFSIFEQATVNCPVVFTTAFDEYALQAFEVNSIDYLLKPIASEKLQRALDKFNSRQGPVATNTAVDMSAIQQALQMLQTPNYKARFVVKTGANLLTINTTEIDYFWSENKMTWLRLKGDGRKHVIDFTLEQLDSLLDPQQWFRVNRKYYVQLAAIQKATVYSNSRLKLQLSHLDKGEEVIVSREKVQGFKRWLAG